jgi:integrase
VTRDPSREVDRLREKLEAGERGGSPRDRDALLAFSDRMKLLRETYGWHRHLKLLRHATRISEHAPVDIVDACEDREAAEQVLTWIHDTYDLDETPETNQNYRVAIRIFGKRTAGDGEVPPALDWISTTLPSNYDPTPDPAKMLWWDEHIRPMLDACTNDRDRAMIAVAWDSGARSGELRSLTIGNVADHKYGSQITVDGKRGQRTITLIPSVPFLDDWLRNHPDPEDPDAPLWSKLSRPEATSYQLKRAVLKEAAEAAGITHTDVTFTRMRKSSASFLASQGVSQAHLEEHHGWTRGSDVAARYVAVFGDAADRELASAHGMDIGDDEPDPTAPVECPRCHNQNPHDVDFCVFCDQALSHDAVEDIQDEQTELRRELLDVVQENPEILDRVDELERLVELADEHPSLLETVTETVDG